MDKVKLLLIVNSVSLKPWKPYLPQINLKDNKLETLSVTDKT